MTAPPAVWMVIFWLLVDAIAASVTFAEMSYQPVSGTVIPALAPVSAVNPVSALVAELNAMLRDVAELDPSLAVSTSSAPRAGAAEAPAPVAPVGPVGPLAG